MFDISEITILQNNWTDLQTDLKIDLHFTEKVCRSLNISPDP